MAGSETEQGAAPLRREPLVLLPGFMTDARIWGAQIEALGARTPLVLPPLAEGETVEEMAQAVLAVAPPRFALAGLSLGGMVAMAVLAQAPERVTRIALIGTNCLAETPQISADRETRIARVRAGRLEAVMREEVPREALAEGPLRGPVSDFLVQMALSLGPEVYLRQAGALRRRPDQQRVLRQVRIPALLLCGAEDRLYLPRRHEFMAGLMPWGELRVIDGAGHAPTLETPEAVTEALTAWLARVPAKPRIR